MGKLKTCPKKLVKRISRNWKYTADMFAPFLDYRIELQEKNAPIILEVRSKKESDTKMSATEFFDAQVEDTLREVTVLQKKDLNLLPVKVLEDVYLRLMSCANRNIGFPPSDRKQLISRILKNKDYSFYIFSGDNDPYLRHGSSFG